MNLELLIWRKFYKFSYSSLISSLNGMEIIFSLLILKSVELIYS